MITLTESAVTKIKELMAAKGLQDHALYIAIRGRGPGGFQYHLQFVPEESRDPEDRLVQIDGFPVIVDAESVDNLAGATLDFVDEIFERGFKIDNPNPLWDDPVATAVQEVLDNHINPAIAAHGGYVSLLGVRDSKAYISFGGGCQGCGMVDVTLKQGVDVMIRQAVPEVEQVLDTTDHAAGTNPYYQPAKGGRSPLAS